MNVFMYWLASEKASGHKILHQFSPHAIMCFDFYPSLCHSLLRSEKDGNGGMVLKRMF